MSLPPQSTTATTATGAPRPCCDDYAAMSSSRRGFLGGAMAMAGASTMFGSTVLTASPASAASASSVLVVLSLRGAADGLSLVVPHGDPAYYAARPKTAIPAASLVAADPFFGLHPALAPLLPMWKKGQMAAVHATGLPTVNRSHFSAQEELEDAEPGSSKRLGWLNRLVSLTPDASPLQGFAAGSSIVPTSLAGPASVMSTVRVESVNIPGLDPQGRRLAAIQQVWGAEPGRLGASMQEALSVISGFAPVRATADNEAQYPHTDLGAALSTAARLIRGDVGTQVVTVDYGGWDMHAQMGTVDRGWMVDQAGEMASCIAAFFGDLGNQVGKVTLVTISEFGRRVVENSNYGTDHGYGNVMLLLGAGVNPGYHAAWPGLTATVDSDLLVTTDYRQVLADIVQARFAASIPSVFPGLTRVSSGSMVGV